MHDTLLRQWNMLRMIPRHPTKITVTELQQRLADDGFETTTRTIQRDLQTLSRDFPLQSDERGKPFGWSWSSDADPLDVPGMDVFTALAFWTADQYIKPLLPQSSISRLQPHFKAATKLLNHLGKSAKTSIWWDKIRVLHRGPKLKAPVVDDDVQQQVYASLFDGKQLEVNYQGRSDRKVKTYRVRPHGLVIKDGLVYLVCSLWDYEDIVLLLLHRMQSAKLLEKPTRAPKDFDLDNYIASGELDYAVGGKVELQVLFTEAAVRHLEERPLSDDQTLTAQQDGRVLLTATVQDTFELRWWLLAFGDQVEVIAPQEMRDKMINTIGKMASVYGQQGDG